MTRTALMARKKNATAVPAATTATPVQTGPDPVMTLTDCIDIRSPITTSTQTPAATALCLLSFDLSDCAAGVGTEFGAPAGGEGVVTRSDGISDPVRSDALSDDDGASHRSSYVLRCLKYRC